MKKIMSAVLAASLMMGPAAVFAQSPTTSSEVPGSTDIDVNGKYNDTTTEVDVYSVDIEWGAMQFTYSVSGNKTWNPATHSFDVNTNDAWTAEGNTITVTNHSSKSVTADFAFEALDAYKEAIASFAPASLDLKSGRETTFEEADSKTSTMTLSGTLPASLEQFTKIGTVTVSLK